MAAPKEKHGTAYSKFEDEKEDIPPVGSHPENSKGVKKGVNFSSHADEVEIDLN